ncbi:restriction endonuclease subunit S [Cloacibacterium sp. Arc13]|uniref:restriction endonuclease subunit S n=1 Tax=unclassified Cloacibacterium TaxID=2620870 RepID=UPI00352E1A91
MEKVKLKDIAEFIKTGKTPPTSQSQYFDGPINWYTPGDFNNGKKLKTSKRTLSQKALDEKKAITFPKDTLLITCIGDIGKTGISQEYCSSNQQITAIKPKDIIDVNYLYYWFLTNKNVLANIANNAVVPILNNKTLQEIDFNYPPLATQQRIAAILDQADAIIQNNRAIVQKYDALTQSLFLDMFGDPVKNEKGWEKRKLNDFLEVLVDVGSNGGNDWVSANIKMKDEEDYALMIRTVNLNKNDFENNLKYVSEETYNLFKKTKVYGGEIIMNKIGSAGEFWLMPYLNRPVSLGLNQLMMTFKNLDKFYFYFYFSTNYGKKLINSKLNGATTKSITKTALRDLDILYPPMELQNQFAERVAMIEAQKQQAQLELAKSEELFASLLQRAFNGELN